MQTTLKIEIPTSTIPDVHTFELDSANLTFIPNVGDNICLPGMKGPVKIKSREFTYIEPANLEVWFEAEE
ncbi:hypothetical protein DYQ86_16270 [Acidobacteria bacterium AB60]|nr:hypothetical protein DYQ86_16270 [Acidobacteria bacterium AB60]